MMWVLLGASGCATLQQISSGHVGCSPEEISISNQQSGLSGGTWSAECKGQRFFCSSVRGSGSSSSLQVNCKPETPGPAAAAAPPSAGGCSYDTQCKGERICIEGKCVDPPAK